MTAPYNSQPHLGATFSPGAVDAYQMPEVISPAPQRVMPEVPENMQDNIAHLEQEAYGPNRMASHRAQYDNSQHYPNRTSSMPHQNYPPERQQQYGDQYGQQGYGQGAPAPSNYPEQPNFSPFPVLRDPPPNVPPTDEQREANLEGGRVAVLSSNDPEMQLAWAQDALSYVEVAMQNELRNAVVHPPRPSSPQVEHQLRTDAINVVSFLADQRHPRAEFIKGMWLEFGKFGFRVDKKEAFRCYSRSAEKGYARAEYRMGMQFENSNEPLKAIKHYERGVAAGDSASYYRLGMMILLGQHGQQQDYSIGLQHIQYAAQTCDENAPQGAYVYGMLLAKELPQVMIPDEFLPIDLNGARINIEKAAYHGFAKAQVKMGAAYELCQLGCDFNPALSLHYNALAARQGEPDAEMAISKWFLCGHEGVFEKNDEMAYTYAKRAAQSGLGTAEFAIGYFHEIGIYVPVDIKEARTWYAKAAANGNKDAAGRIDGISRSKTLSRKDHERVAIARIKSQYASHGRRPQVAEAQSVQPIQETLEMPDPSKMSISDPMDQRPMSAAPYPEGPQGGYPRMNNASPYGTEMRPASAFGINPNIRPHSANPPQQGPPPMGMGNRTMSGPAPQNYRPLIPPANAPYGHPSPQGSPKLDIGYSAPPEAQRKRLQRPEHGGRAQTSPGHPQGGPGGPAGRGNRIPSSPAPGQGGHPPRADSARPQKSSTAPAGPQQAAQKPAAGGLPGKGPKTFEEMGVPQVKNEGDCIVM